MGRASRLAGLLLAAAWALPGAEAATRLGTQGIRFTLDGQEAFLVGMSYYGGLGADAKAIEQDLDDLKHLGFNWLRLWAAWSAHDNEVSAADPEGRPSEPFLARLKNLTTPRSKP